MPSLRAASPPASAARDATEEPPRVAAFLQTDTGHRAAALSTPESFRSDYAEPLSGMTAISRAVRPRDWFPCCSSVPVNCAAEWNEFDFSRADSGLSPRQRMATKYEHIVPLAPQAVKILRELKEYSGHGTLAAPRRPFSPERPIDISTITALRAGADMTQA